MSTAAAAKKPRPKYLNLPAILFEIRLPLPGLVSILHRISGAVLFFPFAAWLLYLLDTSLASQAGFEHVRDGYLKAPLAKLALLVFVWAYAHHFCAGMRFLFLDLNKGIELEAARRNAALVLIVSLAITAAVAWWLW